MTVVIAASALLVVVAFCAIGLPKSAGQFVFLIALAASLTTQAILTRHKTWGLLVADAAVLCISVGAFTFVCTSLAPVDLPSSFATPVVFLYWALGFAIVIWHLVSLPLRFFASENGKIIAAGLVGALALSSGGAALTTANSLSEGYERTFLPLSISTNGTPTTAEGVKMVYTCDDGANIIPFSGDSAYQTAMVPFYCSKETVTLLIPAEFGIAQGAPADTTGTYDSTIDVTTDPATRWFTLLRSTVTFGTLLPNRALGESYLSSDETFLRWDF